MAVVTWSAQELINAHAGSGTFDAFDPSVDVLIIGDNAGNISLLTSAQLAYAAQAAGSNVAGAGNGGAGTGGLTVTATSGTISFTAEQWAAINESNVVFSANANLVDTGAAIAALSAADLADTDLAVINATDNVLTLSAAQHAALVLAGAGAPALTAADTVTVADTAANLLTEMGAAGTGFVAGVDAIDASDALSLTVAQLTGLVSDSVVLTSADAVTLADTGANIAAQTAAAIALLAGLGIDAIDASDNVLSLTVEQASALGDVALTAGDTVTVADTGAAIAALSADAIAGLVAAGVDAFDASTALSLTVDQYNAGVWTAADAITLQDRGANIAALSADELTAMVTAGVDTFVSSNGLLNLTHAQLDAITTARLAVDANDLVRFVDTGENIAAFGTFAGETQIDIINATDDALSLSVAQISNLNTNITAISASDTLTALDLGANLTAAGAITNIVAAGGDIIDASDDALTIDGTEYNAILAGGVALTQSDVVTLSDTGATIGGTAAADLAALAGNGIDIIDASDNVLSLTVEQYRALGSVALTAADAITIADTGENIASLTAAEIAAMADAGVDVDFFNATDDVLALTVEQASALGTIALTAADAVTVSDSSANIEALSATELTTLISSGVDSFDASNDRLTLTSAQFAALDPAAAAPRLSAGDKVTVTSTASFVMDDGDLVANGGNGDGTLDANELEFISNLTITGSANASGTGNSNNNVIEGNSGRNVLDGGDGNDTLYGRAGNDTLTGGNGNDKLMGGLGVDTMTGGAGDDIYGVDNEFDVVIEAAGEGTDKVNSWVSWTLGDNFERLALGSKTDTSAIDGTGNADDNILRGGGGDNVLTGLAGKDRLLGGYGADTFVYTATADSAVGNSDIILDFGVGGDVIDLSLIDANTGQATDQSFTFIGTAAFSGDAGELRYAVAAGITTISGDVDGDATADFEIRLSGAHTLSADDFVL